MEVKIAEEQLRQAQKLEAIGQLTGGIAHDFNNILTGILGYTTLAMRQAESDEKLGQLLRTVYEKGEEAAKLVQQLLAFSRKQLLDKQPMHMNLVLEQASDFMKRILRDNIEFQAELGAEPGCVNADKTAIQQIVTNLCVNAQDALPDGGVIKLSSSMIMADKEYCRTRMGMEPGQYMSLRVADDGIGMDSATLKRIFEPFFTTKPEGKGTGLGLSTVYGLVKQHDGYIECQSSEGKGTVFTVYIPMVVKKEVVEQQEPELAITPGEGTVLLVENDPDVLTIVTTYLEMAGYKVLTAENGVDGLKTLGREIDQIDLVLSDIIMPGISGVELAGYIDKMSKVVPIVFMTGYIDSELVTELPEDAPIMQKPLTAGALTRKIHEIMTRAVA